MAGGVGGEEAENKVNNSRLLLHFVNHGNLFSLAAFQMLRERVPDNHSNLMWRRETWEGIPCD